MPAEGRRSALHGHAVGGVEVLDGAWDAEERAGGEVRVGELTLQLLGLSHRALVVDVHPGAEGVGVGALQGIGHDFRHRHLPRHDPRREVESAQMFQSARRRHVSLPAPGDGP